MKRLALAALLPTLFASAMFACGGGNDNLPPPPPPPPPPPETAQVTPPPAPVVDAAAPAPALPPVTLAAGSASPDPAAPLPTVKLSAPNKDQVIPADKAGDFLVKLDVKNWQTAPGSQHVHLILDNKPYKPIYDTKAGVKLSELSGGTLEEGQHVLVAFPSRANHESVKTKDALVIVPFYVGKKGEAKVDPKKPMLVYSRPKGDYKGEAGNHVLVDFQLANVALAEGKEHVHVTVTGPGIEKPLTEHVEKFGTPLYLDGLRNGAYEIKVELMGADNKPLPGPWNATTRTINIDHDAPSDPAGHAHDATPPAAASDAGAAPAKPAAPPAKPAAPPAKPAAPPAKAAPAPKK
jgi:hypothetical protein